MVCIFCISDDVLFFFFFKQKTAYEMRIIDWSSDVCSSDLPFAILIHHKAAHRNFMPALRHITKYQGVTFPVPANYFDDYKRRKAAAAQEMNIYRDMYEIGRASCRERVCQYV